MVFNTLFNDASAKWLISYFLDIYFLNLKSTIVLYDSANNNKLQNAYLNGIHDYQLKKNIVLQMININGMNQTSLNYTMLSQVELAAEGFISILPNPLLFLWARKYATQISVQRIKDKYHLYLQDTLNVVKFFGSDDLNFFPWHLVVVREKQDYKFLTQKFVGIDYQKPVLLNKYFGNTMKFEKHCINFFPDKIKNMMGRSVRLGSHNYKPYVMFKNVQPGKGNADSLDTTLFEKDVVIFGSEGNICREFCLIWNCTLKVKNYGQDAWGELYENGTSTGIVGGVWRKEVDFGIGSIYNWYNDEFEVANGIAKSAVRIMGPGPKRVPQYLTLILPLSIITWLVLLLTIGICALILNALRRSTIRLKKLRNPSYKIESVILSFLDVFAIFVQQNYSKVNSNSFGARVLISATLITALTMENIYSGQLKSLLTVPLFEDPVDTTEKFAAINWKWGAPAIAWEDTINSSEIPKEKILAKNFEVHNVVKLRELTYTGKWGFAVEKLHSGGFTFGDYIKVNDKINLILLKDDVFFEFTRFIAIRGWPMKERLNTFVLWVFESGLFLHWERSYTERFIDRDVLNYMIKLEQKFVPKPEPEILKISHISGPIYALIFGYILATLVCICEILYGQLNCRRNKTFKLRKITRNTNSY